MTLSSFGIPLNRAVVLLVLALIAASCSEDGATPPPSSPPTETTQPPAPPTMDPADSNLCDRTDTIDMLELDIDGDELTERIVLVGDESGEGQASLAVCADAPIAAVAVNGTNQAIAGAVDLDDDGTGEILLIRDSEAGTELRAAALTLRGVQLTSLSIERTIDLPDGAAPMAFSGQTYDCGDWDSDGSLDLLVRRFRPADEEENVSISVVELDGLAPIEGPLDQFETTHEAALEMWQQAGDCSPDASDRPRVDFSEAGWARVPLETGVFVGEEDLVITSVAANGDKVVAVGTHAPEIAIGGLANPVPLAWWSADGVEWINANVPTADAEILDVAHVGIREAAFVAVGRIGQNAGAWTSTDGADWAASVLPAGADGAHGVAYSVIDAGELGIVAVGSETYFSDGTQDTASFQDTDAAVWVTADGIEWRRIQSDELGTAGFQPNDDGEFNATLLDVAHFEGSSLVAAGFDSDSDPTIDFPEQYPAVWTSTDGATWNRRRLPQDVRLNGITAAPGRLAAYGLSSRSGDPNADAVVLVSSDGSTWTEATGLGGAAGSDGIQSINSIVESPVGGWIALGSDQTELDALGAAAVWHSTTLSEWEAAARDSDVFGDRLVAPAPVIHDAAMSPGGMLVAAGISNETVSLPGGASFCCISRPAIWLFDGRLGGGS